MILGDDITVICPNCGKTKKLLSLVSGNTCGGRLWSDTKAEYPMLPQLSPIQKCPRCGRYYFLDDAKQKKRLMGTLRERLARKICELINNSSDKFYGNGDGRA